MGSPKRLTGRQYERQDCVDNAIYQLICNLNNSKKKYEWDIEDIAEVRELIGQILKQKCKLSEMKFCPYMTG